MDKCIGRNLNYNNSEMWNDIVLSFQKNGVDWNRLWTDRTADLMNNNTLNTNVDNPYENNDDEE